MGRERPTSRTSQTKSTSSHPSTRRAKSERVPSASNRRRPLEERTTPPRPVRQASPQRRKRWRLRGWVKIALLLLLVLLVVRFSPVGRASHQSAPAPSVVVKQVTHGIVDKKDKSGFDESIGSDSAILINADNGDVLYDKDAGAQRAPASLTKMMTAYVAVKYNKDLDRKVQMPKAAFEVIDDTGAATSGLIVGETVTIKDILYAAMLSSGAEAAEALALITSGNEKSFVELMNKEAKAMGLDSSHFTNVTGLDNEKQYSTCRDMARLLKTAMGNSTFKSIVTTRSYTTSANDVHPNGLVLTHTMDKYLADFQRYFETSEYKILGGKTGFTENAGNCLASIAEKKKKPTYIVVTMHATGNGDQYYQSVKDAVNLYGKAYE